MEQDPTLTKESFAEDFQTEKDLQEEMGGAGVFVTDLKKRYLLADDDWKYDEVPEFMDGYNVADFVDTDIMAKLEQLEKEEALELAAEGLTDTDNILADWKQTEESLQEVHAAINFVQRQNADRKKGCRMGHGGTERKIVKDISEITEELKKLGKDVNEASLRGRSKNRKRGREESAARSLSRSGMDMESTRSASKIRGHSIHTSRSKSRVAQSIARPEDQMTAEVKRRKLMKSVSGVSAKRGDSDRHVPDLKPKHLFCGKRGMGKTDRR